MSLAFDTGLTRSVREVLVGAVATALAELKRPTKYLMAIVSLPHTARGGDDEAFLGDIARVALSRVPCVAVATGAAKPETDSGDGLELADTIELGVYVVSGNQIGVVDGRLFVSEAAEADDTKDPGVFAMLEHVTERLQSLEVTLGTSGVSVLRKTGEDEIATFDDATIWELKFDVEVKRSINPDRDATPLMTEIQADHKGTGIPDATSLDPMITTITELDEPEE